MAFIYIPHHDTPPTSTPSVNPRDFPCIAGKAPSIGFSHEFPAGKPQTDAIEYSPDVLSNEAQSMVYANLYQKCVKNDTVPQILSGMNCAPDGFVQTCPNLYNCNNAASVNGTVVAIASVSTPQGTVTASLLGSRAIGDDTVLDCFARNLENALQNAQAAYPTSSTNGTSPWGSKSSAYAKLSSHKLPTLLAIASAAVFVAGCAQ